VRKKMCGEGANKRSVEYRCSITVRGLEKMRWNMAEMTNTRRERGKRRLIRL